MIKFRLWCSKHDKVIPLIITLITAFMYVSALPLALIIDIEIEGLNSFYIPTIANQVFTIFFALASMKLIYPDWAFGFQKSRLKDGLKKYGIIILIAAALNALAIYIGFKPFDRIPSFLEIAIGYFAYLVCVGFTEEILLRGLFINTLKKLFDKNKNSIFLAVIISAAIFGLGHITTALGETVFFIVCKVIWCFGFGLFLGAIYVKTKNIWIPIIFHDLMNFSNLPVRFSSTTDSNITTVSGVIIYGLLGLLGILIMVKKEKRIL